MFPENVHSEYVSASSQRNFAIYIEHSSSVESDHLGSSLGHSSEQEDYTLASMLIIEVPVLETWQKMHVVTQEVETVCTHGISKMSTPCELLDHSACIITTN